jgi:hypothetical protein
MTALAVRGNGVEYDGTNFVLQAFVEHKIEDDLNSESQAMVKHMLTRAGVIEHENQKIITRYFSLQIEALYNLVNNLGGKVTASTMLALLNQTAGQNGWLIEFKMPEILVADPFDNKIRAGAYSTLIRTAKSYAGNVTSSTEVQNEIEKVDQQMSLIDMKVVDDFGLRS